MARFVVGKKASQYAKTLEDAGEDALGITKKVVYTGAGVAAAMTKDSFRNAIKERAVYKDWYGDYVKDGDPKNQGITANQVSTIMKHIGISKFNVDVGSVNTQIGIEGYSGVPTQKYPKGIPLLMLVRAMETGTSFRVPTPTIKNAMPMIRKKVEKTMEQIFENEMEKRFK